MLGFAAHRWHAAAARIADDGDPLCVDRLARRPRPSQRRLRAAVLAASRTPWFTPVVEARAQWSGWHRLGTLGPRYTSVVPADAALDGPARRLCAETRPVLLAHPTEVPDLADRLAHRGPVILRLSTAEAHDHHGSMATLHDPVLGPIAARVPACAHWHVLWRHLHLAATPTALVLTPLTRRPAPRIVIPPGPFTRVVECRRHRTPILITDPRPLPPIEP
ncbi:hypothetical protein ACOBQX_06060 [Actinokineospora sp. G85]|uniref:hypothetical protein n=1 Tax=Actinokineospora sp. G85 TaxID=3406626 RepID=UPI003C785BD7